VALTVSGVHREVTRNPEDLMQNTHGLFPWYAIRVKSRHEKTVAGALRGKGYIEFLPTYVGRHRSSGRLKDVDLPLFPGYVFCRFNQLERLPIVVTPGVVYILSDKNRLLTIDEQEIAFIQRMITTGFNPQPWPFLRVGDPVQIEEGPLRGLQGTLQATKGRYCFVVSVALLQRSVAVEIDRRCVIPMTSKRA
jgi:transcription antitermination factor NusG